MIDLVVVATVEMPCCRGCSAVVRVTRVVVVAVAVVVTADLHLLRNIILDSGGGGAVIVAVFAAVAAACCACCLLLAACCLLLLLAACSCCCSCCCCCYCCRLRLHCFCCCRCCFFLVSQRLCKAHRKENTWWVLLGKATSVDRWRQYWLARLTYFRGLKRWGEGKWDIPQ